jgi:hypothetical protein|tara:strand:+ start:2287 stop:3075 length:789 start_codon:yes stop_codon:yes gene_type:complete
MIDEIICIGTSFTEGHGLNPHSEDKISNGAVEWYRKNKDIIIKDMKEYSWPSILEEESNIKTRNLGKCGSSIEYLMRNVEEIIETEDCSNKFFILEYSSWGRSELWDSCRNKWLIANWGHTNGIEPSDGYSTMLTTNYNGGEQLSKAHISIYNIFLNNFFNEHEFLIQRDRNFLNLLYKLNSLKIKYQVLKLEGTYWTGLENSLFNYKNIFKQDLWGYVNKKGLDLKTETNGEVDDAHPSIKGHNHMGKLIYKKIKTKLNKL